jgi:hypothetical protein
LVTARPWHSGVGRQGSLAAPARLPANAHRTISNRNPSLADSLNIQHIGLPRRSIHDPLTHPRRPTRHLTGPNTHQARAIPHSRPHAHSRPHHWHRPDQATPATPNDPCSRTYPDSPASCRTQRRRALCLSRIRCQGPQPPRHPSPPPANASSAKTHPPKTPYSKNSSNISAPLDPNASASPSRKNTSPNQQLTIASSPPQ